MIVIKYRDGYNNTWIYKVIQYDGGRWEVADLNII
jgi:hypothetical protein